MGECEGVDLIDFNSPQHVGEGTDLELVKREIDKAGLKAGAVCLRYPKTMIRGGEEGWELGRNSRFGLGKILFFPNLTNFFHASLPRPALTNPDPELRSEAVRLTKDACRIAKVLGCTEVVVWSAYDGYDYTLACDYGDLWDRVVSGFKEVCDEHPDVKVSLEYKPTDENTRFFIVPSTGAALNLCRDVDRDNFGLTLDFGHCLMAGENPAQSAFMAAREGKLFGIQLNDGYSR